jgi:DNA repair ATPase RecN
MAESSIPSDNHLQILLDRLSANEMRLGEAISAISQSHTSLEHRVRALEQAETSRAIISAREDERDKALYSRLDKIEKKVESIDSIQGKVAEVKRDVADVGEDVGKIKGNFSKASWTVISAVILAVVAWILKGGLA